MVHVQKIARMTTSETIIEIRYRIIEKKQDGRNDLLIV